MSVVMKDSGIDWIGNVPKHWEVAVLKRLLQINNGADFKTFAENEIIRQTKEWINDNLPSLVEKVVKQEIERVIAKVGS